MPPRHRDEQADRKRTVDLGGSLNSIEAAREVGIRRFVPGRLAGAPGTGRVSLGTDQWNLVGGDTRVADALAAALQHRAARPGYSLSEE